MQDMESLKESRFAISDLALNFLVEYGPNVIGALAALVIGLWTIRWILKLVNRGMSKSKVDDSLKPFLVSLVGAGLKVMLAISIMSMLGIVMTSFIAILASAGLAVGLALSGTLQNFAGGVMILLFKPFKVGDYIEAQGYSGTVKDIQIFVTTLTTPDNRSILIPNGGLSNGALINYSSRTTRRVDWAVGVANGENIEKVRGVVRKLIDDDPRILDDPASFIKVGELAGSAINFTIRGWVKADDYWDVFFDMNEKIYTAFEVEGISIP